MIDEYGIASETDDTFPTHTAEGATVRNESKRMSETIELPGTQTKVWIQTLNSPMNEEAQRAANFFTAREMYQLRKGSELYQAYVAQFTDLPIEEQADFIATHEVGTGPILLDIVTKYPAPLLPEKGKQTDEEFMRSVAKYDEELQTIATEREQYMKVKQEELKQAALKLTPNARVQRCVKAYIAIVQQSIYRRRLTYETLFRAVRKDDDRRVRYYTSVEDILELDDDVRDALVVAYERCDSVRAEIIPT